MGERTLRIHRAGGPGGQRGGLGRLRGGHGITIHFLGFTIDVAADRLGVLFHFGAELQIL